MGLKSQQFHIAHNSETIAFSGQLEDDKWHTTATLSIDGEVVDTLTSTPKQGLFGCAHELSGELRNGDKLTLTIQAHFFMRPL